MHVASQCATHQLFRPGLAVQQIFVNTDLQRPGVAFEKGIRVAAVPLTQKRLRGWSLANRQRGLSTPIVGLRIANLVRCVDFFRGWLLL